MAKPRKQEWTVRIIVFAESDRDRAGLWLGELLRYAGLSRRLADFREREVFELSAPAGVDTKAWADQNAARMRSFGLNAAAAPRWDARTNPEEMR